MNDFLYSVSSEADVAGLVEAVGITDDTIKRQQTARVRVAWVALRKAKADAENIKGRGRDDTDPDQLLTQPQLDDIADICYRRYCVNFPPFVAPSCARPDAQRRP